MQTKLPSQIIAELLYFSYIPFYLGSESPQSLQWKGLCWIIYSTNQAICKSLTHSREWHLWMSHRCLSVLSRKNIWFQKHLYFLIFLHWKISAILLYILCYFVFIHHKWVSKGEESFTCVVNYRWPQTRLWSHKPVFKPHLWGGGQDLCVYCDGCWVMWSFTSFSIKSEMKPSHKTPTKDGSKQNHFTRKKIPNPNS